MLANIYYFIGIFIFLSTLSTVLRFRTLQSIKEWQEKYEKVIGRKPNKRDFRSKKEFSLIESQLILSIFELIWVLIGFFTHDWWIFVCVIFLSYTIKYFLEPIKWTIIFKLFTFSFVLLRIFIYLYVIVNHFFLHYDTYNITLSYIRQWS